MTWRVWAALVNTASVLAVGGMGAFLLWAWWLR